MWASADQYTGKDGATIDAAYARDWNASDGDCPRFYTDTASREIYRETLWTVMTRQNTYTGLAYNTYHHAVGALQWMPLPSRPG